LAEKILCLRHLTKSSFFFNRFQSIKELAYALRKAGYNVGTLSEHSSRTERRDALTQVSVTGKERAVGIAGVVEVDFILATDVLARGMDMKGLTHIVNYDTPVSTNAYLHRAGRIARLNSAFLRSKIWQDHLRPGESPTVITFWTTEEEKTSLDNFSRTLDVDMIPASVSHNRLFLSPLPRSVRDGRKSVASMSSDIDRQLLHSLDRLTPSSEAGAALPTKMQSTTKAVSSKA